MRRLFLSLTFVVSGFVAGHRPDRPHAHRGRKPRRRRRAPPAPAARAVSAPVVGGLPDLSSVASRAIPSVMNISSLQVFRSRTRRSPPTRSSGTSSATRTTSTATRESRCAEPRLRRHRPPRRLHPDQQSRGRATPRAEVAGRGARQARDEGEDRRRRSRWTDIALLKIDARGLPVLPWGDPRS